MTDVQRENRISDYIEKVFHIISDSAYVFHKSGINDIDYIVEVYEYDEFTTVSTFIAYSDGRIVYSHLYML